MVKWYIKAHFEAGFFEIHTERLQKKKNYVIGFAVFEVT